MAAKTANFGVTLPRRKKKRNDEPMYMRSKHTVMSGDISIKNTASHKPSAWKATHDEIADDKIFLERRDLIGQWFNSWNDTQRKRFFDFILDRSAHSELKFILGWFNKPVRMQVNFVTILPRVVSSHIFSYLDPRSLCRAACVSWHWKWLVDQDMIWKRKCLKFGWYLPYKPSELENGAWKKHYAMCIQTMNIKLPEKTTHKLHDSNPDMSKELTEGEQSRSFEKAFRKWKKHAFPLIHTDEPLRPPWVSNNFRPKDLELADKVLFAKPSQNRPLVQSYATRKPQPPSTSAGNKHSRSKTTPGLLKAHFDGRDTNPLRRWRSEGFTVADTDNNPASMTLSETIKSELSHQKPDRIKLGDSLNHDDFLKNVKPKRLDSSKIYTTCDAAKGLQEFSLAYPNMVHPRVLFISSEIPAYELLVNAMLYGVLPVVYHYEGTTLCGLLEHLTAVLQGRKARSVGFFVSGESGRIDLVRGERLSLSSLNKTDVQNFWQALCMEIQPSEDGGHVDIFYPLGGTDSGIELLAQLEILTGLAFSSPTGTVSSVLKVSDDWLPVPEGETPAKIYFNEVKLTAWVRAAEYVEGSMTEVRGNIYSCFDDELHGLASKVIGEIMFKAFGLVEISEIQDISKVLVEALVLMTQRKHEKKENPTTRLINCLQECQTDRRSRRKRTRKENERVPPDEKEPTEEERSDVDEELDHWEAVEDTQLMNSNLSERLSLGERRSVLAYEILSSERDYCNTLTIIQNMFRKPLEAAVKSNRPVIGSANIRMIFNDSETLLAMSKELMNDLSRRLQEWDSHQCLGDVFLKFNTKLKGYMNFLNNYPITLVTIEKCQKQHPAFRDFLLRLQKQPNTRLTSLQNLLLAPCRRIKEYVCLLEALIHHTPVEHKDHTKLKKAIEQLKQLKSLVDEAATRFRREKNFRTVQKRIDNCPALVERGRFFFKQEDMIHLRQADAASDVKPEFRVFQNIGNIGLFLFNDCLVVTIKELTSVPFKRTLDASYKYHSTLPLSTVNLEDVTDSKYVQNAFIVVSSKRLWICQAKSNEAKINWISLLSSAKRTTLNHNKNNS